MKPISTRLACVIGVAVLLQVGMALGQSCCGSKAAATEATPQKTCPVMGGEINPDLYADVSGFRVYVCCAGCLDKVRAEPGKALAQIRSNGETPERVPVVVCGKCGQVKGSEVCCKTTAQRCGRCGLVKGSPGCCVLSAGSEDARLCGRCGEVEKTADCCVPGARRCTVCGKAKGAPGCCL